VHWFTQNLLLIMKKYKTDIRRFIRETLIRIANKVYHEDTFLKELNKRGVLNWTDRTVSGEKYLLSLILPKILLKSEYEDIVIFDIGANKCDYSREIKILFLNKQLKKKGKLNLHLFEPQNLNELNVFYAEINSDINIVLNKVGVSKERGILNFYSNKVESEHATTIEDFIIKNHQHHISEIRKINVVKIDDYLSENNLPYVDFIKIDTEGNEFDVLLGMESSLAKGLIGAVHFEFNEMNVYSRFFFKDFFDFFEKYHFEIYRLLPNGLMHITVYDTIHEIFKFQNYVAIKKDINVL